MWHEVLEKGTDVMNKKPNHPLTFLGFLVLLSLLFLPACDQLGLGEVSDPTVEALSQAVAKTATASDLVEGDTNDLATAQAQATENAKEINATQTAQAASVDVNAQGTATVAAPIVAELPTYGLDPSSGQVGWLHPPLTLEINGYQQYTYGNDFMNVTAADFVLAADITWNTQYGGSGCGFMFRSDGDKQKPNQYMIIASRFANGRVLFLAMADGELANLQDFYPKDQDNLFQWRNDTTNRLAIVARGNIIEIYSNYAKIGEVDTTQPPRQPGKPAKPQPPTDKEDQALMKEYQSQIDQYQAIINQTQENYQVASMNFEAKPTDFKDGFVAMVAMSESGSTRCEYTDAWLWLLKP